jgi:hypothetical protein
LISAAVTEGSPGICGPRFPRPRSQFATSTGGLDYCAREFDATPVYSDRDVGKVNLPGAYDLIWSGSVLTHFDERRFIDFLDLFRVHLAPNGLLSFSTNGRRVADALESGTTDLGLGRDRAAACVDQFHERGFGFQLYPGQTDAPEGISLSAPSWVSKQLQRHAGWRIVSYAEMGWVSTQDLVACLALPVSGIRVSGGRETSASMDH